MDGSATQQVRQDVCKWIDVRYVDAMNETLERAIAAVSRLPDDAQETIASLILAEMEAGRGREERFARSENKLSALARRALKHHKIRVRRPIWHSRRINDLPRYARLLGMLFPASGQPASDGRGRLGSADRLNQ